MFHLNYNRREVLTLAIVFAVVLLGSALGVYLVGGRFRSAESPRQPVPQAQPEGAPERQAGNQGTSASSRAANESFFNRLFSGGQNEQRVSGEPSWTIVGKIFLRLLLSALLGAALAFRPRKRTLVLKRNPYVAQTEILIAIVASALMIIVGDNAARAFGIFAAVSLVRFRTNIRDPKEITVLLISLALGLATGVGRWDLAFILALFALIVLWILEHGEPGRVFRAMELKVSTRNVGASQNLLRELFKRHGFSSELRAVNRENEEEPLGKVVYSLDLGSAISTDVLTEQILALDSGSIDSIEWEQKKSLSYLYQ